MDETLRQAALAVLLRDLISARFVKDVFVTTPAAGTEWSQVVPGGVFWQVLEVGEQFATSAVVANRTVSVETRTGDGVRVARYGSGFAHAASITSVYGFAAGLGAYSSQFFINAPLPSPPIVLQPGYSIRSSTGNIDVGDTHTAVVLKVVELSEWGAEWFSILTAEQLANVGD